MFYHYEDGRTEEEKLLFDSYDEAEGAAVEWLIYECVEPEIRKNLRVEDYFTFVYEFVTDSYEIVEVEV